MMEKIHITDREEYEYVISRGYQPLLDHRFFTVEFSLRLDLQRELFPQYSRENNQRFYRWVWDNWPDQDRKCQETGIPIEKYNAGHISHLITRGAHPEMAYDGRNVNLLIRQAHEKWERKKAIETMVIWPENQKRMIAMFQDYKNITKYSI